MSSFKCPHINKIAVINLMVLSLPGEIHDFVVFHFFRWMQAKKNSGQEVHSINSPSANSMRLLEREDIKILVLNLQVSLFL